MESLFVTASGYLVLSDPRHPLHNRGVVFLSTLFNQTVKVYSSVSEVAFAAELILKKTDFNKMTEYLELVVNGGIKLLPEEVELLPEATRLLKTVGRKGPKTSTPSLQHALSVSLMKKYDIKNIFTFDPAYQKFNVLVWPKAGI